MRLLVQVATGPENPTRAALGPLAARTAPEEGHEELAQPAKLVELAA